mmetsp:Transcript_12910/g.14799  ORF Transcript_12910/g.14799 Transcript_12910/m.14799 type:complete len:243 (+) Transcript_12910:370-1098(+)
MSFVIQLQLVEASKLGSACVSVSCPPACSYELSSSISSRNCLKPPDAMIWKSASARLHLTMPSFASLDGLSAASWRYLDTRPFWRTLATLRCLRFPNSSTVDASASLLTPLSFSVSSDWCRLRLSARASNTAADLVRARDLSDDRCLSGWSFLSCQNSQSMRVSSSQVLRLSNRSWPRLSGKLTPLRWSFLYDRNWFLVADLISLICSGTFSSTISDNSTSDQNLSAVSFSWKSSYIAQKGL